MRKGLLLYNGRVLTQADGVRADSIAFRGDRITAVGRGLQYDPDLAGYRRFDLKGRTVAPGFVDAHTHIYFFALSFGRVLLDGLDSLDACLRRIARHAAALPRSAWVEGEGYAPDRFRRRVEPDRYVLDRVTGGRPAFLYSKDQHSAWVNSRALEMAGITSATVDPPGGRIERFADGTPTGILRENPAIDLVRRLIPAPSRRHIRRCWERALEHCYRRGVTGVHSFDSAEAFDFFVERMEKKRLGLRIAHYPRAEMLPRLEREGIRSGYGDEFFQVVGIKVFADGSLGSQTAWCFHRYRGSRDNYGVNVTPLVDMKRVIRRAARLGFPCAVHGIGDRAVATILDAFESTSRRKVPPPHRIEHVQLIRRRDIPRLRRLGVVASVQPSHCPSDIALVRRYWGARSRNAYVFRSLLEAGVVLAFGSDAPIEPLDPLGGMAAAARRAARGSRDVFHPEQRLTPAEALHAFTVGPAMAAGQPAERGWLLPGYAADLVILRDDISRLAPSRLYDTPVLATILAGKVVFAEPSLGL